MLTEAKKTESFAKPGQNKDGCFLELLLNFCLNVYIVYDYEVSADSTATVAFNW